MGEGLLQKEEATSGGERAGKGFGVAAEPSPEGLGVQTEPTGIPGESDQHRQGPRSRKGTQCWGNSG